MSTLLIYKRRHDDECLAALATKRTISSHDPALLSEVERKFLTSYRGRDCNCAYWVRGTTDDGRVIKGTSLHCRTYEAAQEKAKELNAPPKAEVVTLETAREAWLSDHRTRDMAKRSIAVYRTTANEMINFFATLTPKVTLVKEVTPVHLNLLRAFWMEKKLARLTRRNRQGWLTGFFNFCLRMGWLDKEPPTAMLTKIRKTRRNPEEEREEATLPLDLDGTDTNYRKLLAAIPSHLENRDPNTSHHRKGTLSMRPDHLVAITELMHETGLRVSDALMFQPDRMVLDSECAEYTTNQIKTGSEVTVYIPLPLAHRLRGLKRDLHPRYLFINQDGLLDLASYSHANVYTHLRAAGRSVGLEGVRAHRLRDSFAVNRLNEGLSLGDLQKLLGHSSIRTTERYYAPFVLSRRQGVRSRLLSARAVQTTSPAEANVVAINEKRRAS